MRAWQIPLRLATGTYILSSGLDKRHADPETAEHLHSMAANAYPVVKRLEPQQFAHALAATEITVGATLLSPMVSPATAGLALGGFSGALLNLYWKSPGLHRQGDPRPTPDGMALAKDSWMAGIAAALIVGAIGGGPSRRSRKRAKAKTKVQAQAAAARARQRATKAAKPVRTAA